MTKPVRMKDIARDLNVSVVTVSKVLRNHSDIGDATRERVLQRMKELNYRPNLAARTLVTGRTFMIGFIVPDLMHTFFAEIARTLAHRIRDKGYSLLIASSDGDPELERQEIDSLLSRRVDALLLASTRSCIDGLEQRIPVVLIDRKIDGANASFVGVNDEKVGYMATRHLVAQGYRRIAHIHGPELSPGIQRYEGYRRALAEEGLPFLDQYVVSADQSHEGGSQAMRQLLALHPRPDAVFSHNDPTAIGALKEALQAGLRVPQELGMIGVGNTLLTDLLRVPLSTVDQSNHAIGEQAAALALNLIEAKTRIAPKSVLLEPELIVRESSRLREDSLDSRLTPQLQDQ